MLFCTRLAMGILLNSITLYFPFFPNTHGSSGFSYIAAFEDKQLGIQFIIKIQHALFKVFVSTKRAKSESYTRKRNTFKYGCDPKNKNFMNKFLEGFFFIRKIQKTYFVLYRNTKQFLEI